MIATGKRSRKATGLNRYGLRRARHAHKSAAKVRRSGWTRSKKVA